MKSSRYSFINAERYVYIFVIFLILSVLYFFYLKQNNNIVLKQFSESTINTNSTNSTNCTNNNTCPCNNNNYNLTNYSQIDNQQLRDVLLNPYTPPIKQNQYIDHNHNTNNRMPINVKTQSGNNEYKQIGILTRVNGVETVLPLMGRPLIVARDKWNYYTMNDKNNMIKLPIVFKNKSCTSEIGCDSVYDGDTVFVEGYKDLFQVTLYDNNSLEYIPYL